MESLCNPLDTSTTETIVLRVPIVSIDSIENFLIFDDIKVGSRADNIGSMKAFQPGVPFVLSK